MARDLRKVHQSADELRFAYPHAQGWLGVVLGAPLTAWGVFGVGGMAGVVLAALGVLLFLSGLSNAFYRFELALDLTRRTYQYRRGHVISLEQGSGPFDDITAVILKKELERRGSDEVDEWEVALVFRDWPLPLEVAETRNATIARREAEYLAARIGVPLEEKTGY